VKTRKNLDSLKKTVRAERECHISESRYGAPGLETIEDPAMAVDAVRLTAAQVEADGLYARWAELTEKAE
jgi:hypothetical protein